MPNELIGIDIQGITTINERLKKLPDMAKDMGVESANEYIVNQMQVQPPVPNKPFQWSSDNPLCHCTRSTVTKRAEGTFRSLRYSFGGDHPSQTTHHALSPR